MTHLRITKYDPAFRDASGAYQRDEWTSFSDVGQHFEDGILSVEDYEATETAYVASAMNLLNASRDSLYVVGLEIAKNRRRLNEGISEGMAVSGDTLEHIIRLNLRDVLWCKLEEGSRYVHFGYDYYMYVGIPAVDADAFDFVTSLGLFVEDVRSPYWNGSHE